MVLTWFLVGSGSLSLGLVGCLVGHGTLAADDVWMTGGDGPVNMRAASLHVAAELMSYPETHRYLARSQRVATLTHLTHRTPSVVSVCGHDHSLQNEDERVQFR